MNLLIIDNDTIFTYIHTRVAETSGLFEHIHAVESGTEALTYFQKVCKGSQPVPDIVLLDLHMPVMNGIDVVKALQNLSFPGQEDMSIIILTSSNDASEIQQAREFGIDHCVPKPLTVNSLQSAIFALSKTNSRLLAKRQRTA